MGTRPTVDSIVKVALDTSTEVGNRCARVLLGETSVEYVGIVGDLIPSRRRSGPIKDLSAFDVLVSDGTKDFHTLMGRASVAGVPIVLWPELSPHDDGASTVPVLHGANLATTLTAALSTHPDAAVVPGDIVHVGWTEPGKPLRKGYPLTFPEPVGNVWSTGRSEGSHVAFVDDEWGGAVINIEGPGGRRIVGVSDHAAYLEAMVLAAVGLVAAEGTLEPAIASGTTRAEQVLNKLAELELEVAVWRSTDSQ